MFMDLDRKDDMYSGVISKFNSNFNKNKKTIIFGGKQTRDLYVNDVVKLSILLMKIARQKINRFST